MARHTVSFGALKDVILYEADDDPPIKCTESAAENAVFGSDASGNFRPTMKFWNQIYQLLTMTKLRNADNVIVKTADGVGNPIFVED